MNSDKETQDAMQVIILLKNDAFILVSTCPYTICFLTQHHLLSLRGQSLNDLSQVDMQLFLIDYFSYRTALQHAPHLFSLINGISFNIRYISGLLRKNINNSDGEVKRGQT